MEGTVRSDKKTAAIVVELASRDMLAGGHVSNNDACNMDGCYVA